MSRQPPHEIESLLEIDSISAAVEGYPRLYAALRDLLAAIESDSRTRRGDYYQARKQARAALKGDK